MSVNYDEVLDLVNDFFSDKTRTQGETKSHLRDLRDEIDVMIDSLEDDE